MRAPYHRGRYLMRPWVTVLPMSGGAQSFGIWKLLHLGLLERPTNLVVINADPGMESTGTKPFVDQCESECREAGVPFLRVRRNLYRDLLRLKTSGQTRFDCPPFWTKNRETGKRGRLMQRCTAYYKITAMDQALRRWMDVNLGVSRTHTRLGANAVRKWIGFAADEIHRIREPEQTYQFFEYPLIELGWSKAAVVDFFIAHRLPAPPRSVCNACFANDVSYFREMAESRPSDWAQAVAVDDAIRDLSCIGVRDECYVSWTLVSLRQLAAAGFPNIDGEKEELCHSGHCFV